MPIENYRWTIALYSGIALATMVLWSMLPITEWFWAVTVAAGVFSLARRIE